MDASSFADDKLPGELRNIIYELVLYESSSFRIAFNYERGHENEFLGVHKPFEHRLDPHFLAITKTCRQMRQESLSLFYKINTFTQPMAFFGFGSKMSRYQREKHTLRLNHARKWLESLGMRNSNAISHYELTLGTLKIERPNVGLWESEWWTKSRILERKLLLPLLKLEAIFVSVLVWFDEPGLLGAWRQEFGQPACLDGDRIWVGNDVFQIRFTLPHDQNKARKEIKRTCQERLKELEGHIDHEHCLVAKWMPHIRVGLKKSRALMLHAVGIK